MFETDDDDFTPNSSSKLFSIFNNKHVSDDKASLSYKAPKQPNSASDNKPEKSQNEKSESQSAVILAKVIDLWQMENGQSKLLGKHIVAIIGNRDQKIFELIIYKQKTSILIRLGLSETISFYKYSNNFIGFYDSSNSFWNVCFNNAEDYESFLGELSKENCGIITKNPLDNKNECINNEVVNQEKLSINNSSVYDENIAESKQKSDILSRITKMGQPILPKNVIERKCPVIPTDSESESSCNASQSITKHSISSKHESINKNPSDSETESSHSDSKPTAVPRKFKKPHVTQDKQCSNIPYTGNNLMLSTSISNSNQHFGNNQMMLYPQGMLIPQGIPDYNVNNFLIAQNTDLKNNLAEINMKLNTMLNNQNLDNNNINLNEYKVAESRIKCLNLKIENLTSDLDKIKKKYDEVKTDYDCKCRELSESQAGNNDSHTLKIELDVMKSKLMDKDQEIQKLNLELTEKLSIIEMQNSKLKNFKMNIQENETYKANSSREMEELKKKLDDTHMKLLHYENKEREILESSLKNNISQSNTNKDSNKIIKETMNDAFMSIMESFDENASYSYRDIQNNVLKHLKYSSLNLITQLGES